MPSSKQINEGTWPAYMTRRKNMPGPWTGGLVALSGHLDTQSATAVGLSWRIPGGLRPMAFSWQARATTGSPIATVQAVRVTGATVGAGTNFYSTNIDLTTPGIVYFTNANTTTGGRASGSTVAATQAEIPNADAVAAGGTSVATHVTVRCQHSASSVTDLNCVLWCLVTTHLNTDPTND